MAQHESEFLKQLTQAEIQSREIIEKAKHARAERLNAAKFDAQSEAGELRKELEEKYQAELSKQEQDQQLVELQQATMEEINTIEQQTNKNKSKVIEFLISKVLEVDISVPAVLKGEFA